jgi:alkylated DNA repair protein (DNA oxidative demethylase)
VEPLSPDLGRERREIAPGAVHLPSWLDEERQRDLAELFERYAQVPVPMRAPAVRGNLMSVQMVCLGWHWQPYRYSRVANDVNGEPVAAMPEWLCELGAEAVTDAYGNDAGSTYRPDVALINYYDDEARMGMHQDKDERVNEPVVSLSVGDTGRFRFGNVENRAKPYRDLDLVSGDAFVFGRESRYAFHGVTKILPGTAPRGGPLLGGRLNVTIRVTGLS